MVVKGVVKLYLENVNTKEKEEIILDGNGGVIDRIEVTPFTAHLLENIGNEIADMIFFTSTVFNPENVDGEPYTFT